MLLDDNTLNKFSSMKQLRPYRHIDENGNVVHEKKKGEYKLNKLRAEVKGELDLKKVSTLGLKKFRNFFASLKWPLSRWRKRNSSVPRTASPKLSERNASRTRRQSISSWASATPKKSRQKTWSRLARRSVAWLSMTSSEH